MALLQMASVDEAIRALVVSYLIRSDSASD